MRRTASDATRQHPIPCVLTQIIQRFPRRFTWEELDAGTIHPASLSPQVVLERVSRMGDLFAPVLQADQRIDEL